MLPYSVDTQTRRNGRARTRHLRILLLITITYIERVCASFSPTLTTARAVPYTSYHFPAQHLLVVALILRLFFKALSFLPPPTHPTPPPALRLSPAPSFPPSKHTLLHFTCSRAVRLIVPFVLLFPLLMTEDGPTEGGRGGAHTPPCVAPQGPVHPHSLWSKAK